MNKETIGTNAGIIWALLNEKGAMTLAQLKRASKIKEPFLSMSIGWLAREEKLCFVEQDGTEKIDLVS